jgi:hypothetical protein
VEVTSMLHVQTLDSSQCAHCIAAIWEPRP